MNIQVNTEKKLMLLSKDLIEEIIQALQLQQEFNGFNETMDKALEILEEFVEKTDYSDIYVLQALSDALKKDPQEPKHPVTHYHQEIEKPKREKAPQKRMKILRP